MKTRDVIKNCRTVGWLLTPLLLCLFRPALAAADTRIVVEAKVNGRPVRLMFDTGSFSGVELNSRRWQQWREEHQGVPATPVAYFAPGSGLLVREECWADKLDIEGFSVADVPVMQGRPDAEVVAGCEATVGLYTLSRFETIVDGRTGSVYMRPVATPPPPYNHNRLGAVFAPKDLRSQELVGYVVEGSPAYQAGIRGGDVLLRIGALDVTKWRTDPAVLPLSRFWERPAGTELRLALTREGRRFECVVWLRDILGPQSSIGGQPPPSGGDRDPH